MPPARGRRAPAPPVEPEPVNGEVDYGTYLDKAPTAKMTDYATWFEDQASLQGTAGQVRSGARLWQLRLDLRARTSEVGVQHRAEREAARGAVGSGAGGRATGADAAQGSAVTTPPPPAGQGRGRRQPTGAGSAPY